MPERQPPLNPIPSRNRPRAGNRPDTNSPDLTAQLDTLFPQSERDFLADYAPWVPRDPRGGDRRPAHRHDGWTPAAQRRFLLALRYHRNVTRAARSVGLSRENAYALRAKWPPFAERWDAACGAQACTVADLVLRQVVEGVDEPIMRRGVVVGQRRVNRMAAALWVFRQLKLLEEGRARGVRGAGVKRAASRRVDAPLGWRTSGLVSALLGPGKGGR
jgi:hypothetical protein